MFPIPGVRVQSLVGELRSHMPLGMAKLKKKKKIHCKMHAGGMAQLCIDLTLILGVNRCHVGVRWRVLIGVPLQKQLQEGLLLSTAAIWGRLILRHEHCPVCLQ